MAKGDYLKNYKGPRGRINKADLNGLTVSNMVEFTMPETGEYAYGKIIEFKRRPEEVLAEISVKALQQPDGSWVRYHDYFDFKRIRIADLTAAPQGVLHARTKVTTQREAGENNER